MSKEVDLLKVKRYNKNHFDKYYIYALWKCGEIVYVGKTNSLENRIKAHIDNKDFDEFSYFECKDEEESTKIETKLIFELDPFYNKQIGDGYISIKKLRSKIRQMGRYYKYNSDFYVPKLRKILMESSVEMIKYSGKYYINKKDVDRAMEYILIDF